MELTIYKGNQTKYFFIKTVNNFDIPKALLFFIQGLRNSSTKSENRLICCESIIVSIQGLNNLYAE